MGKHLCGHGPRCNRLDPETGHIKQYTTADGLANNFINVSFRDREGALWFGTLQGFRDSFHDKSRQHRRRPSSSARFA
jgi:streptogramin lyase